MSESSLISSVCLVYVNVEVFSKIIPNARSNVSQF